MSSSPKLPVPHFSLIAALSGMGQFAISTYLPAFDAIGSALGASPLEMQQTLTAYVLPFALTIMWHGAISDAVGRRRFILLGLFLFLLGSLGCAAAPSLGWFLAGRVLQGLSAGVGIIVGRAMVRDVFDGVQAQKQMALVAIFFAIAPAVAPLCGGWLLAGVGWRGIFVFLSLVSGVLLLACWRWLPETLPAAKRHPLHVVPVAKAYGSVLANGRFMLLAVANAAVNVAIYVYVFSAPTFVMTHLGLGPQSFAWLFWPLVGGMVLGSVVAHRLAGRMSPFRSVVLGHGVMLLAGIVNISLNALGASPFPWALLALPIFSFGMMITQPGLQLLAMDQVPERRGMASSCYSTVQQLGNALSTAFLIPLILGSTLEMALGMAGLQLLGAFVLWVAYRNAPVHVPG